MIKQFIAAAALALLTMQASAQQAAYTYTGNNFDTIIGGVWTTSDSVSMTMTLSSLPISVTNQIVVPVDYTISDGINTYTPASPGGLTARITTDASGNITQWVIGWGQVMDNILNATTNSVGTATTSDSAEISECQAVGMSICASIVPIEGGRIAASPGSWSAPVVAPPAPQPAAATPVPTMASYGLVLTALGLLLVAGRRLHISGKRR